VSFNISNIFSELTPQAIKAAVVAPMDDPATFSMRSLAVGFESSSLFFRSSS
jgi:hypothetical protein